MFNRDFYPTPKEVIDRMLMGVDVFNKVVFEPSAGKGDIVDSLKEYGAKDIIACEINPDLAKIVASKCNLIGDDFLKITSEQISHIDMIVMNPPFSADEKHILHAYEIAPVGCEIISLCNESIVKYSHTTSQEKLKETIEANGRWESFGDCFGTAERRTNVSVACIRLFKAGTKENEFDGYFSLSEEHEQQENGIMPYNSIRDIVNRYVGAVKMFDEVMDVSDKINEIASGIAGEYGIRFGAYQKGQNNYTEITREVYKKELQKSAWNKVFAKMNMDKYATKGVRENINKFVEQQRHIPFTMRNVYRMIELIVVTHGNRMNDVLVEAFENICSYSAENSTAGEKWRTNSDYMVNRKFIVPYMTDYDTRWPSDTVKFSYRGYDNLDDIVKALCYLTGTNYDETTSIREFVNRMNMEWGQWYNWGFFRIRGYKKGTMHFEFQDEDTWMLFNRKVAEIKGWALPKSTRKARAKTTDVETYNSL